jgi:hypothetical protein
MGLTHKIYTIESTLSLDEIVKISRLINDKTVKKSYRYYCKLTLTDQSYFDEIDKRFPIILPYKWRSFNIEVPDSKRLSEIILLEELYERFTSFSHKSYKTRANYLSYSIEVFKDLDKLNLLYDIPQDNEEDKLERIKEVMGMLSSDKVLMMGEEEINLIFPTFLALNKANRRFGTWSYTNRFGVEAGSRFVRLRFDQKFFNRWKTQIHEKAQRINECMAKITHGTECYKGLIYTKDTKSFLAEMDKRKDVKLMTSIFIDLEAYEAFNIYDIVQMLPVVKDIEVEIEGISWLSSNLTYQNNTVSISFNEESYDFELSIYKDEPDEIVTNIEKIIGHKIVFKEWS